MSSGFELRARLWEREGRKCWFCTRVTFLTAGPKNLRLATVDHLIPRIRGGADDDTNRVNCCQRCNLLKGVLTEAEFRSMSSVDALIFNDAATKHGFANLKVTEVAMSAGPGYVKPKARAAAERLQSAGYFTARGLTGTPP